VHDAEAAAQAFTSDSRPVVLAWIQRGGTMLAWPSSEQPPAVDAVRPEVIAHPLTGELTELQWLRARGPTGALDIPFRREQGDWRIDVFHLGRGFGVRADRSAFERREDP
jgi:hypothetical protein